MIRLASVGQRGPYLHGSVSRDEFKVKFTSTLQLLLLGLLLTKLHLGLIELNGKTDGLVYP